MQEFVKNNDPKHGAPILDSVHFLGDLFPDIIETGHGSTKRHGYY